MKNAIIRVCYIRGVKFVEVVYEETAIDITASEPRQLMREARKYAAANNLKIVDIVYI